MNGSDYLESKSNPGKAAGIRQTCDLFLEPGEGDLRSLFQGNPLWDRFITLVGKPEGAGFCNGRSDRKRVYFCEDPCLHRQGTQQEFCDKQAFPARRSQSGSLKRMERSMDEMTKHRETLDKLRIEWKRIYENGSPSGNEVCDGFLLNRIRRDMVGILDKMKKENGAVEEIGRYELPELVADNYMARETEIRCLAAVQLKNAVQSVAYGELQHFQKQLGKEGTQNIPGRSSALVEKLSEALKQDDLCTMRILSQQRDLREQMEEELEELHRAIQKRRKRWKRIADRGQINGQYSIYDLMM